MRTLKKIVLVLVLLLVGLVLFLKFLGGATIKQAVNTGGPLVLGVPVTLEHAALDPILGRIRLKGLHVGNPEGFKTDGLFDLGSLDIKLNMRSLASDTIQIQKIEIKAPKITMERGLTKSNLGALIESLEKKDGGEAKEGEKPAAESAAKEGGKKVVIDEISIAGAQLNLSVTAMGGLAAPLPLPPVTLRDVGKESDGASLVDVISRILKAILGAATDVIAGAGKLVIGGASAAGGAAIDGAAFVGGAALDGVTAVGGAAVDGAKVVGGAAVDGAAAVGGAAVDGAKAVGGAAAAAGGAVLDGAGSAVKGVGSLLGLGGDKDKKESSEKKGE
ncbi:MAG: AsmA family protein [Kiritimatiellae bacterium]|nr:AsmA family protein [Kiritimatiellia bacterium]